VNIEIILFILRAFAGLVLLLFLGALYWIIWRDFKQTGQQIQSTRTTYGFLIAMAQFDGNYAQTGAKYPLLPITTLGRSATNSVVVNDSFASSEHSRIVLKDGQWWLEDRNSRNGTLLNEEPILDHTILTDGDMIGIGNYFYKFELSK
jgi:FHA domain